jgi:hypothetical protein
LTVLRFMIEDAVVAKSPDTFECYDIAHERIAFTFAFTP